MSRDPIFITPRMLPRSWGGASTENWFVNLPAPNGRIGEVWSCDGASRGADSDYLGALIRDCPHEMLGDLGRAPPSVRFIFADRQTDSFDTRISFWRVLESDSAEVVARDVHQRERTVCCRVDDLLCAEDCTVDFRGRRIAAVEIRPNFLGRNRRTGTVPVRRLPALGSRLNRETWFRDPAVSAEVWRLPAESSLTPDGETCHVLTALTDGAVIAGRPVARGQSVFVPAYGHAMELRGEGSELLVSYPDQAPTSVWRHMPAPPAKSRADFSTSSSRSPGSLAA
jgi:hypothetical protein